MLDIGCGTATHIADYARQVGPTGTIYGIDVSHDMIAKAQERYQNSELPTTTPIFQVADAYQLPLASNSCHVVKEDRVLQHLTRPLEVIHEMVRVTKPNGLVVVSNPDFRSFQLNTMERRYTGDKVRPPPPNSSSSSSSSMLDMEWHELTTKVLNGVIPILCRHPSIGLSQCIVFCNKQQLIVITK